MDRPQPLLPTLTGLWRRSLLREPDGTSDTTSWVNWLQGQSLFVDLRQTAHRPEFHTVECLRDLKPDQLAWMATQQGFAGELHFGDGCFEWRREIDFQPETLIPDQASLRWDGDILVEKGQVRQGQDKSYIEHWQQVPMTRSPAASMRLMDDGDGTIAYLIRMGGLFMFARSGFRNLTLNLSLSECLEGASSLRAQQDMVDFEISQGVVTSLGWIIQRSSLPWREGLSLNGEFLTVTTDGFRTHEATPEGRARLRRWRIIEAHGPLDAFAPNHAPELLMRERLRS